MAKDTQGITFLAFIHQELTKMSVKVMEKNLGTGNSGQYVGRALFWDTVQAYAKKQSDLAWEKMEEEEIINTKGLSVGEHVLLDTRQFLITGNMSQPYKTFEPAVLANAMKSSKYKVPLPFTVEQIERAKIPGKGRLTLKILEK